jgi:phosphoglycerate-specific signal transduction histidine kinase
METVSTALIIAAEIAFWLILLVGLVAWYGIKRPQLDVALVVATPFVSGRDR